MDNMNEVVKYIRERNIQYPDELSIISKWDILQLLIPGLSKDKVQTQKKNYSRLKTDSMLFLSIQTIVRMFLAMIYLEDRPSTPNDKINLRSFKYMIKNKLDEIEDLETELENIKEKNGYIEAEYHHNRIKTLKEDFKRDEEDYKRRIQKLEDTEKFLREKIEKVEERVQAKLDLKYAGWTAPTEEQITYN